MSTTLEELTTQDICEQVEEERPWNVVVDDDPVNTMRFVVYVFRRVFTMSEEAATELMLQVHTQGKASVWSGAHENANHFARVLGSYQLWARVEQ